MKKTVDKYDNSILRQKAEALLKKKPGLARLPFSESDILKLVHELEVHQIELEMQNEELILAKQREAELATEKYVELYDFAPSGYFTLTRAGQIIDLNLSGAKMLGKERSHLKNNSLSPFVSKNTQTNFELFLSKIFKTHSLETCEITLSGSGNFSTYVHLSGIVNQNTELCMVTMVDITEIRKLAELNEILLSSLPHPAMYIRRKDKMVLAVNKIAADLGVKVGGYCWRYFMNENHLSPKDKELVTGYPNLVPPEFGIKCTFCLGDNCFTEKTEQNKSEVPAFGLLWDTYWIKINDDIYLHYAIDITERRKMEKALQISEEHNKALLNANPDLMFVLDKNGVFVDFHSRNDNFLYVSSSRFIGKNISAVLPYEVAEITHNRLEKVFRTGQMQVYTYQLKVKRKMRDFESRLVLCGNSLALSIVRDITERKQMEENLIVAKEKAEESDRLKSAFLANMSHEIRTPMSGILGFAELLKQPGLSSEQQKMYINIIEKSGVRMLNIINDIIDISKIESGQMKVSISKTNVNEQIEYIYSFFKDEVGLKGMKIFFKNSLPEGKSIIKTDREKFYAILTNLVKNAIKYSEKGTIELGYVLKSSSKKPAPEPAELEFFVKDIGIGIPEDRKEAIFERFIQADVDDKKAQQGAGLGLTITKAFVEMLGGRIWVESVLGKGSVFYFTLPYNPDPVENIVINKVIPADIPELEPTNKLKILVAEDDEFSEMLITIAVERFYSELQIVKTGYEAVEACRNNPDLDLILMDIKMPGMDGYEAIRQIRKFNKEVVIVVQTAYGLVRDREKAIESGCDDYISKPYSIASLTSMIKKYFSKHTVVNQQQ